MQTEGFADRRYTEEVRGWWASHHGQPINERLLSQYGAAVLDEMGLPIAVCYIYPSLGSELAFIGWTVRAPFLSGYAAGKALKLLLAAAETHCQALGYSLVYAAYDSTALQRLCLERGYFQGSAVQEFFKEL